MDKNSDDLTQEQCFELLGVLSEACDNEGLKGLEPVLGKGHVVAALVMDLVPLIVRCHTDSTYDRTLITSSLLQYGKTKELNLSTLEQLENIPCQNTAHLILPLLVIPNFKTLISTVSTLHEFVIKSKLCEHCQDKEFEKEVVGFISRIDERIFNGVEMGDSTLIIMQRVILSCLSNRVELINYPPFSNVLAKLKLSPSSHLFYNQNFFRDYDLEHALIACSQFSTQTLPQVYQHEWLFSHILSYVSELLRNYQNEIGLEVALNTLVHFTKINFSLKLKYSPTKKDILTPIINHLIKVAINHTTSDLRSKAAACITKLPDKFPSSQKLSLVKKFVLHQHSGVSSLFIHYFKEILHQDSSTSDTLYSILDFNTTWDVLQEYDRINATLNLIQYIILRKISTKPELITLYLDTLTTFIKHKVSELSCNEAVLRDGVRKEDSVATVLHVDGEDLREPSVEDQLEVIQVARCRLDLVMFNIARCRV